MALGAQGADLKLERRSRGALDPPAGFPRQAPEHRLGTLANHVYASIGIEQDHQRFARLLRRRAAGMGAKPCSAHHCASRSSGGCSGRLKVGSSGSPCKIARSRSPSGSLGLGRSRTAPSSWRSISTSSVSNRYAFGRRTAWLRPVMKTLAEVMASTPVIYTNAVYSHEPASWTRLWFGAVWGPLPRTMGCNRTKRRSALTDDRLQQLAHLGRIAGHLDPARLHHGQLLLRGALAAGNDGAGMAHAFSGRRGDAGDESDDGLFHVVLDPVCGGLLVRAADLPDHHHRIGVRIVVEQTQHVDMLQAVDRIAARAHGAGLAQSQVGELRYRLVGERSRTRHDADASLPLDVARHDSDLDFPGGDDPGAVRAHQ